MRDVRLLTPADIDAYTSIAYNSYPSFKDLSEEGLAAYKANLRDIIENDPDVSVFGLFDDGTMIAVMRVLMFTMNYFGEMIPASGLGYLGVHLLHKKKRAAQDLVDYYERFSVDHGATIGLLLPFRPDYYKITGYGFGSKWHQYRIPTGQIPSFPVTGRLDYLAQSDLSPLYACRDRVARQKHGMLLRIKDEKKTLENDRNLKIVGSFDGAGNVDGYIVFEFENGRAGNYTINHMHIREMEFENVGALRNLLGFIKRQQDQVQLVVFGTGEEYFHYLFANPMDDSGGYTAYGNLQTNTQFIGVMYKVLQAERFAAEHPGRFGAAAFPLRCRITEERGRETVVAEDFVLSAAGASTPRAAVTIDRADFSSLMMGCVTPGGLYAMGRLEIDNPALLPELDAMFYCRAKPVCNTDF